MGGKFLWLAKQAEFKKNENTNTRKRGTSNIENEKMEKKMCNPVGSGTMS